MCSSMYSLVRGGSTGKGVSGWERVSHWKRATVTVLARKMLQKCLSETPFAVWATTKSLNASFMDRFAPACFIIIFIKSQTACFLQKSQRTQAVWLFSGEKENPLKTQRFQGIGKRHPLRYHSILYVRQGQPTPRWNNTDQGRTLLRRNWARK